MIITLSIPSKRAETSPCSHWRSCARSSAVLRMMWYLSNSGCWRLGWWPLLLYQKKKQADSYTAIRPSEIILLSESVFVFSVKAMPIHGDLPALPTIGASEIAAPALSIGNPDGSKCSVPVLCTAGSSQHGQAHKPRHGQDTGL